MDPSQQRIQGARGELPFERRGDGVLVGLYLSSQTNPVSDEGALNYWGDGTGTDAFMQTSGENSQEWGGRKMPTSLILEWTRKVSFERW